MLSGFNKLKIFLLTAFCTIGCASHFNLQSSPPQAKVELISQSGETAVALGETPLLISKDSIVEKQLSGPYILRVSKEGFAPREIVIVTLTGLELDMNVELKTTAMAKKTNRLIDQLFAAQNLAQKGEYQACLTQLDSLKEEYPDVAAIFEMRGSIRMIKGEYALAVKEFTQALSLDPDNKELRALLDSAKAKGTSG